MTERYRQILGNKIKQLREISGLTQEELSSQMNYSQKYISAIERGVKGAKMEKLQEMARIFKVPLDVLASDADYSKEQLKTIRGLILIFEDEEKTKQFHPAIQAIINSAIE